MSFETAAELTGIDTSGLPYSGKKYDCPPEGDKRVGPWVNNRAAQMLQYRKKLGIDDLLIHNHELYRGKFFQLKTKYPQVPVNLIWKTINTLKGNLTDNKPRATIQGRNGSTDLAGNAWQAAYDEWWELTSQQRILQESVGLSELYGFQTEKMIFNPDLDGGLGEIETVLCDSFGILFWPGCVFDIQKSPRIAHLEAMEIGEIYRRWPHARGKVRPDPNLSMTLGESRKPVRGNRLRPAVRPLGSGQQYPGTFKPIEPDDAWDFGEQDIPKALVIEMWEKDYTMEWVNTHTGKKTKRQPTEDDLRYLSDEVQPILDLTTNQPILINGQPVPHAVTVERIAETYQQSKYPGFLRCIHVTNNGKLVLDDLPNPSINPEIPRETSCQCHLWDKFPFNRRLSYSDGLSEYGLCYDSATEILTDTGWKPFDGLTENDLVATRNPSSKEFEWQKPSKITNEFYQGPMVKLSSRSVDLLVTPKHRVLLDSMPKMANGGKKRNKWVGSGEVVVQAESLLHGHNPMNKIPMTSKWVGVKIHGKDFKYQSKRNSTSYDIQMSGDDYCALMGAYISEGNLRSLGGIEINQRQYSKGYEPYSRLVDRLGGSYNGRAFILSRKALTEHFKECGKSLDKHIPNEIMNATPKQIKIFLEYYLYGDGHTYECKNDSGRGHKQSRRSATTISKRLADQIIELAQKVGWSASVSLKATAGEAIICNTPCNTKESYIVNFRYSKAMGFKVKEERYSGGIHCVTVPNGIVYVRRNGKPAWCGNCIIEQIEPLVIEISKKITKIAAHLDVAALPPLILPKGCGIDRRQVNNLPDRIWEPISGISAAIRFLQLPALPQDYGLYIQLLIRLVDMVTGLTDVSEGRKPGGITANSAIRSLQEKAQVVFREKIRNVEVGEVEKGRMFISLAQNWYTRQRKLKYFGETGEQEIEFQGVADQFQGEFAFKVETGSTLPTDRWAMQQLYMQLAQGKMIDTPALLEMLNIPKRDEIVQRMMQGPMRQQLAKLQRTNLFDPKLLQAIATILALPQKAFERAFPQAKPENITAESVEQAGIGQGVTGLPTKTPQIVPSGQQQAPPMQGMM